MNDRKRPPADAEKLVDATKAAKVPARADESTPAYGSKEYWEQRYKRFRVGTEKTGEIASVDDEPDPLHAWYFTYDELAPLILPLILGEENTPEIEIEMENGSKSDNEGDDQEVLAGESKGDGEASPDMLTGEDGAAEELDGDGDNEEEWCEEEEEEQGDEDDGPERPGLVSKGPIEILEVGCGDVPLGDDILAGLVQLESKLPQKIEKILIGVVCMDYSKNVIDSLEKKGSQATGGNISIVYDCEDARKMKYASERFGLILEKGTMDAMLSDSKEGGENCREIVAEMARVLAIGGCILVISHINAHEQKGLDWLDNIVVPGLRKGAERSLWNIEVHGNEIEGSEADLGPAVYIMHKGEIFNETQDNEEPPAIPLSFYSY